MENLRRTIRRKNDFPLPPASGSDDAWRDADWVAAQAGVSRKYVYELVKQGHIPAHKPGERLIRFRESEVMDWIRSNRVEPQRKPSPTSAVPSSMPKQRHDKVRVMRRG